MLRKLALALALCVSAYFSPLANAATDGCIANGTSTTSLNPDYYLVLAENCVYTNPSNGFQYWIVLQADTNFVFYSRTYTGLAWTTVPVWQTGGIPGAQYLYMNPNGNLNIMDINWTIIWTADLGRKSPVAGSVLFLGPPSPILALRYPDTVVWSPK